MTAARYTIAYGKCHVPVYRVYARPLAGVTPIPESPFTGRDNVLLAMEVDVEVFGTTFLPSYTEGDNSQVVATDSMKNYALRRGLEFAGATMEEYLEFLGRGFLAAYPQMEQLRLGAREVPFAAATVPQGQGFARSGVLLAATGGDHGVATLELEREGQGVRISGHRCGRAGLQLLKVTGSSFTRFVRDQHTTLPERVDRPLFVFLDVSWRYARPQDMLEHARYVPSEQVRDLVATVFHEFVSESIQHLVHEMGRRLLERFPQLTEVSFEAQNRTWDPAATSESNPRVRVYTVPFPAFGLIKLTMEREG